MALPPRTPCPARDVLAAGGGGELVQPGRHAGGEQRAPHSGGIDLGISAGQAGRAAWASSPAPRVARRNREFELTWRL
jgi:hypothetical protein